MNFLQHVLSVHGVTFLKTLRNDKAAMREVRVAVTLSVRFYLGHVQIRHYDDNLTGS